jgi:Flp pilus assembly pilin Flp
MSRRLRRFLREQDGQDIIEYSLLMVFIVIACMWFVGSGRTAVNTIWTNSANTVSTASSTASSAH